LARGKAATDPDALFEVVKAHCLCPERIVMETGTLCHWLTRALSRRGLDAALIDARQARAVVRLQHNKTDANGADLLAEIARTGFFRAVAVKREDAQGDRLALKARLHLVGQRRDTENAIRGLLASFGHRFPKGGRQVRPPRPGDRGGASRARRGDRPRPQCCSFFMKSNRELRPSIGEQQPFYMYGMYNARPSAKRIQGMETDCRCLIVKSKC
jgi:hypothetical protein